MLISLFPMIVISTSLTVRGQPSPRFHVEAWLPFRNCEIDYYWSSAFCATHHPISCTCTSKVRNKAMINSVKARGAIGETRFPKECWEKDRKINKVVGYQMFCYHLLGLKFLLKKLVFLSHCS